MSLLESVTKDIVKEYGDVMSALFLPVSFSFENYLQARKMAEDEIEKGLHSSAIASVKNIDAVPFRTDPVSAPLSVAKAEPRVTIEQSLPTDMEKTVLENPFREKQEPEHFDSVAIFKQMKE